MPKSDYPNANHAICRICRGVIENEPAVYYFDVIKDQWILIFTHRMKYACTQEMTADQAFLKSVGVDTNIDFMQEPLPAEPGVLTEADDDAFLASCGIGAYA